MKPFEVPDQLLFALLERCITLDELHDDEIANLIECYRTEGDVEAAIEALLEGDPSTPERRRWRPGDIVDTVLVDRRSLVALPVRDER